MPFIRNVADAGKRDDAKEDGRAAVSSLVRGPGTERLPWTSGAHNYFRSHGSSFTVRANWNGPGFRPHAVPASHPVQHRSTASGTPNSSQWCERCYRPLTKCSCPAPLSPPLRSTQLLPFPAWFSIACFICFYFSLKLIFFMHIVLTFVLTP